MSRAVIIGALDGVHLGHAALVKAARAAVGERGTVTALTFEPHPLAVLRPGSEPPRISTLGQRRHWLKAAGADEVEALEPTPALLRQSPREFIAWMVSRHAPQFIVEGSDFRVCVSSHRRAEHRERADMERLACLSLAVRP